METWMYVGEGAWFEYWGGRRRDTRDSDMYRGKVFLKVPAKASTLCIAVEVVLRGDLPISEHFFFAHHRCHSALEHLDDCHHGFKGVITRVWRAKIRLWR